MKKIGLDVRLINASGIGVTIRGLLDNLSSDQREQITLFASPTQARHLTGSVVSVPWPIYGLKQQLFYPNLLNRSRLTLFHMPHYDFPVRYTGASVVTVHDLIHLIYPEFSSKPFSRPYSRWMLSHVTRQAKKIIVVSENTRRDVLNYFPECEDKIQVIYPAASSSISRWEASLSDKVLEKYGLKKGYVLYVGNLRGSKNTPRLLSAYSKLATKHPDYPKLVLVGRNFLDVRGLPTNNPNVVMLGAIPDEDLNAIYSGALFFVFPSLYEGFGLPPLEAMATGVPVLCSSSSSLKEVCGNAAEYIDPQSEDSIVAGLFYLAQSETRRKELIALGYENVKRFSWKRFALSTWQVYLNAMD